VDALLNDKAYRQSMLDNYDEMIRILGSAGASRQAASKMIALLKDQSR
jgi:lipid-A-disaccharide synthase